MPPQFITQIEEAFAARRHAIVEFNTEDRFIFPGENQVPINLDFTLSRHFQSQGYNVLQYVPSIGVTELPPDGENPPARLDLGNLAGQADPIQAFNGLAALLRNHERRVVVLIQYSEYIARPHPAGSGGSPEDTQLTQILHQLGLDDDIATTPNRIICITYTSLPDNLLARSRGYQVINVNLPTQEERQAFIEFLEGRSQPEGSTIGRLADNLNSEDMARITSGMPLYGIEALYRVAGFRNLRVTREAVRTAKAREIRNIAHDLLEVTEPEQGFEAVAGLVAVKSYFQDIIPQIIAGKPDVPQAALFQGVPGVGKSHTAKALAKEMGWPCLELRNVRSQWVGESERNVERVIQVTENLAPALLFFDEIDQLLGQRGKGTSGDSGVSERILARIFSWLGSLSHRGRIMFIGATNRPDILDPALLDRFGVSIPFLKPTAEELVEMVPMFLERFGRSLARVKVESVAQLVASVEPSGRDLQEILISAAHRADKQSGKPGTKIGRKHVEEAIQDHIQRESKSEMNYLSLVALSLASRQSLLPWNDISGLRREAVIPEWLVELGVVDLEGRLDQETLHKVIAQLRQQRYAEHAMR